MHDLLKMKKLYLMGPDGSAFIYCNNLRRPFIDNPRIENVSTCSVYHTVMSIGPWEKLRDPAQRVRTE